MELAGHEGRPVKEIERLSVLVPGPDLGVYVVLLPVPKHLLLALDKVKHQCLLKSAYLALAHVGDEHVGHRDGAVVVVVVLDYRDHRPVRGDRRWS